MIDRSLWDDDELEIFDQYSSRCLRCNHSAVTLHEITPKSNAPKTWKAKGNRVPLCAQCHDWAHRVGTKISKPILIRCQEEYANWR